MAWSWTPVFLDKIIYTPDRPINQKKSKSTATAKATIHPLMYNLSK